MNNFIIGSFVLVAGIIIYLSGGFVLGESVVDEYPVDNEWDTTGTHLGTEDVYENDEPLGILTFDQNNEERVYESNRFSDEVYRLESFNYDLEKKDTDDVELELRAYNEGNLVEVSVFELDRSREVVDLEEFVIVDSNEYEFDIYLEESAELESLSFEKQFVEDDLSFGVSMFLILFGILITIRGVFN